MKLDHFALGVRDFDERHTFFTAVLGLRSIRTGIRYSTGTRIAMLADDNKDFKVELIELGLDDSETTGLLHLAFRVDDLDTAYHALVNKGLHVLQEPHELKAAKAHSALLQDSSGLKIQLIQYAPDSPDR